MREQGKESEWTLICQRCLWYKTGMHQGSVLSPFLFAVLVDIITELV